MQQIVEFNDPNEEPIVLQYPDFQVFATASSHAYGCRCFACKEWWLGLGPEEDGKFGPFGLELWDEYAEKHGETVREMKLRLAANAFFIGDENIFPDELTTEELEERVSEMIAQMENDEKEYANGKDS